MKIKALKVFQSVKVGGSESTFMTSGDFDMELKGDLVYIKHRTTGDLVITPITNTPWFKPAEAASEPKQGTKSAGRTRKKEAKKAPMA